MTDFALEAEGKAGKRLFFRYCVIATLAFAPKNLYLTFLG